MSDGMPETDSVLQAARAAHPTMVGQGRAGSAEAGQPAEACTGREECEPVVDHQGCGRQGPHARLPARLLQ